MISKVEIAQLQLRAAVQLYNKNNFVASITLAGASEDLLKEMAEFKAGTNSEVDEKEWLDQMADYFGKSRVSKDMVRKSRNRIKNELKHHDRDDDSFMTEDFQFQAEILILGVIRNYELITGHFPKDRTIKNWFRWISL